MMKPLKREEERTREEKKTKNRKESRRDPKPM